jgi:hypothetical protein
MLNITYCRVSTEEQAAEGFSIDGQAEKLRAYAELHDLGPVMLIEDPGRSGKNLERPGLQQRRVLVEELLDVVAIFPDHLEVTVNGALRLNVTLDEVGLTGGRWQFVGVGGGI